MFPSLDERRGVTFKIQVVWQVWLFLLFLKINTLDALCLFIVYVYKLIRDVFNTSLSRGCSLESTSRLKQRTVQPLKSDLRSVWHSVHTPEWPRVVFHLNHTVKPSDASRDQLASGCWRLSAVTGWESVANRFMLFHQKPPWDCFGHWQVAVVV